MAALPVQRGRQARLHQQAIHHQYDHHTGN